MMFRFIVLGCLVFILELTASLTNAMSCGFTTDSPSGTITGPLEDSMSRNYAFECVWTITAPYGYQIHLRPESFQLPGLMGLCADDWVQIESLFGDDEILIHGTYCGSSLPPNIVSKENRVRIHYKYTGSIWNRKSSYFSIYYKAELDFAEWIKNNTKKMSEDKENLPRVISALFLLNESYFTQNSSDATNLITQYRLKLAGDLVRNRTRQLTASALSHHVTALLGICNNPRSVYGIDLVGHLRRMVDKKKGLVNPYYLLTLCNAGDRMTSTDVKKLKSIIDLHKQDIYWLDFQAMAVMGLVCAREQNKSHDAEKEIVKGSSAFKSHQKKDGSFGSLQTTSLVMQALTTAEATDFGWNKTSAMKFVERSNYSDGSFGNIYNLFAAIPVISNKTLLHINASNCDFTPDGLTPLEEIGNKLTEPIHVLFSLWIGDRVDFAYSIVIKVPSGTKLLDFMRLAAKEDEKFQFRWTYVNNIPYVYQINGLVNDPASGKYWTFLTGTDLTNLKPLSKGLENYVPSDDETAVMWYRTIDIEHPWKEIDQV